MEDNDIRQKVIDDLIFLLALSTKYNHEVIIFIDTNEE